MSLVLPKTRFERVDDSALHLWASALTQLVWIADAAGNLGWYNPAWRTYTGTVEDSSAPWSAALHPDCSERVGLQLRSAIAGNQPWSDTIRLRRNDGVYGWFRSSAVPIHDGAGTTTHWFATHTDISREQETQRAIETKNVSLERKVANHSGELAESAESLQNEIEQRESAEGQVRQLQKMEALGQLTGGIAHDFNNMLAVIIGALNLIQRRLNAGDANVAHFIAAAFEGAKKAATLTQRLLAFSRQQPLEPKPINANRMVSNMSEMLSQIIGENVELESVLSAGLWQTNADAGQLESAIVNLAVNARDAMPAGGRLTIETSNIRLDESYARSNLDVIEGQYVMIAVSDTGTGMPPAVVARAFDPFFTTKGVGKGTGLGLSQVHGFVSQSGGHVKIYSEEGHGTAVKVYLPRFYGKTLSATPPSPDAHSPMGTGSEIILVVEDDDQLRLLTVAGLRDTGYTVLHANCAASALETMALHSDVAVLFTDIVMPEMNGRQLADAALKVIPRIQILYTTGYTRDAVVHNGVLEPGVHLLPKPYSLDQLTKKLRQLLDSQLARPV